MTDEHVDAEYLFFESSLSFSSTSQFDQNIYISGTKLEDTFTKKKPLGFSISYMNNRMKMIGPGR